MIYLLIGLLSARNSTTHSSNSLSQPPSLLVRIWLHRPGTAVPAFPCLLYTIGNTFFRYINLAYNTQAILRSIISAYCDIACSSFCSALGISLTGATHILPAESSACSTRWVPLILWAADRLRTCQAPCQGHDSRAVPHEKRGSSQTSILICTAPNTHASSCGQVCIVFLGLYGILQCIFSSTGHYRLQSPVIWNPCLILRGGYYAYF
ncbi:hypothetical protein DL93DRAFT_1506928 [Clavulina sp. PMI_390]|nr:hypothetical protein DL93DRAFT_1506928 [Clavulina sp. PMI_390]